MNAAEIEKIEEIQKLLLQHQANVALIRSDQKINPAFEDALLSANNKALHDALVKVFNYDL